MKAKRQSTGADVLAEATAWKAQGAGIRERLVAERDQALARALEIDNLLDDLGHAAPAPKVAKPAAERIKSASPVARASTSGRPTRGSVGAIANGRWRYQVRLDGKYMSKGFDTRQEAERALADVLNKHGRQSGVKPTAAEPAEEDDEPEPAGRDPLVDLLPGVAPAPHEESAIGYIHPGNGWGTIAAGGIVKHLLCNGTGKVPDPGKKRGKTWCRPCSGEGFRRAIPRAA